MAGLCSQKLSLKYSADFLKSCQKGNFGSIGCILSCTPRRSFHKTLPLATDKKEASKKCTEKCSKKQRDMMTVLQDNQYRYLQPRNPQISGYKFTMAPPFVEAKVDVYLEEACRIREECRAVREGKSDKKK